MRDLKENMRLQKRWLRVLKLTEVSGVVKIDTNQYRLCFSIVCLTDSFGDESQPSKVALQPRFGTEPQKNNTLSPNSCITYTVEYTRLCEFRCMFLSWGFVAELTEKMQDLFAVLPVGTKVSGPIEWKRKSLLTTSRPFDDATVLLRYEGKLQVKRGNCPCSTKCEADDNN